MWRNIFQLVVLVYVFSLRVPIPKSACQRIALMLRYFSLILVTVLARCCIGQVLAMLLCF